MTATVSSTQTDVFENSTGTRLGDEDATYWFLRRGLGWSVVLQLVWDFEDAIPEELAQAVAARLTVGRLHRRLVVPRVPGARPKWVPSQAPSALHLDGGAVPAGKVDDWAEFEMSTVELDAQDGRCWRLRMAPTTAGGTAVSLCALHLVADGRSMVAAAQEAFSGSDLPPAPGVGNGADSLPLTLVRDAMDVGTTLLATMRGVLGAARSLAGPDAPVGETPIKQAQSKSMAQRAPRACGTWATATVDANAWDRVAAAHGGTANTLFIAVIAGLLRSSGYAPLGDTVKVGIPVDRRDGPGDDRANATAGVSITLTDNPVAGGDLGGIRRSCKEAYRRLADGRRPALVQLQPLVWLLPPSLLLAAATAGDGMPDAMVSNLGDIPAEALRLGAATARRVAFRGNAQGVDPELSYRFGDGAQSWLLRADKQITFSVLGFDESRFADRLRTLLADELRAWDLPFELW